MYGCGTQAAIRASQHWEYGLRSSVYVVKLPHIGFNPCTYTFLLHWRDLRRFQMTDEMLSKISFILSFFFPTAIHSLFLLQYIIHQKKKSWSKGSLHHVRAAQHSTHLMHPQRSSPLAAAADNIQQEPYLPRLLLHRGSATVSPSRSKRTNLRLDKSGWHQGEAMFYSSAQSCRIHSNQIHPPLFEGSGSGWHVQRWLDFSG